MDRDRSFLVGGAPNGGLPPHYESEDSTFRERSFRTSSTSVEVKRGRHERMTQSSTPTTAFSSRPIEGEREEEKKPFQTIQPQPQPQPHHQEKPQTHTPPTGWM